MKKQLFVECNINKYQQLINIAIVDMNDNKIYAENNSVSLDEEDYKKLIFNDTNNVKLKEKNSIYMKDSFEVLKEELTKYLDDENIEIWIYSDIETGYYLKKFFGIKDKQINYLNSLFTFLKFTDDSKFQDVCNLDNILFRCVTTRNILNSFISLENKGSEK